MLARRTSGSASGYWQTPVADDAKPRTHGKFNSRGEPKLSAQALRWPTPADCRAGSETGLTCSGDGRGKPNKLGWAAAAYPTPTATQYKGWSPGHNRANSDDRLDYAVERNAYTQGQDGPPARLSPDWVEWLMGWPIGWTSLERLGGMDEFLGRDSHWGIDPADEPDTATPRVAGGVKNRAARLKAIGNGQVPQCAAMAFIELLERLRG